MSAPTVMPFVIGQWVRGPRFYGRRRLVETLLGGGWHWIAGLRRIGKTSLLKQLEQQTETGAAPIVPLFWDLQGVDGVDELGLTFADALLDAEELLDRAGIVLEELEDPDLFAAFAKLAAALERRDAELLLLVDEAEELVPLDRTVPGVMARLWRTLQEAGRVRVVLASSPRL